MGSPLKDAPHWEAMIFALSVIGCCWFWLFRGKMEQDRTHQVVKDITNTPKPREGTVFYDGEMQHAYLFPTSSGKWNATIMDRKKAREKNIVGTQLYDYHERDVFLRDEEEFYYGHTCKEWKAFLPFFCLQLLPITFSILYTCNDIPALKWFILVFGLINWLTRIISFKNRVGPKYASRGTRPEKCWKRFKLIQLGMAVYGATLTWPHTADGWAEKLDCDGPLFFLAFIWSTLYMVMVSVVILIVTGVIFHKFCCNGCCFEKPPELEDSLLQDGRPGPPREKPKRGIRAMESRCCCFWKTTVQENVELSTSETVPQEL